MKRRVLKRLRHFQDVVVAKMTDKSRVTELTNEIARLQKLLAERDDASRAQHELELYQEETRAGLEKMRDAQRILERSRDRYAELYDWAPVPYVTLDGNGLVVEINLAGADLLGVERSKIVGTPFSAYIDREDRRAFSDHQRQCRASPGPLSTELKLVIRESQIVQVKLVSRPTAWVDKSGRQSFNAIMELAERRESGRVSQENEAPAEPKGHSTARRSGEAEQLTGALQGMASERSHAGRPHRSFATRVSHAHHSAVTAKPAAMSAAPQPTRNTRPADEKIRVLLADDHNLFREGLAMLLSRHPDIEVVAQTNDGDGAVDLAASLRPDIVLMDITMPGLSGIDATRAILSRNPHVKVVGLSMHSRSEMDAAIRDAGASAYVTKGGPSADLIATIRLLTQPALKTPPGESVSS
jgi:PAS domain S-box-containing protein